MSQLWASCRKVSWASAASAGDEQQAREEGHKETACNNDMMCWDADSQESESCFPHLDPVEHPHSLLRKLGLREGSWAVLLGQAAPLTPERGLRFGINTRGNLHLSARQMTCWACKWGFYSRVVTVFSSGVPSAAKTWTCWSGARGGQQKQAEGWSTSAVRKGCESWGCSAWRREGSGETLGQLFNL